MDSETRTKEDFRKYSPELGLCYGRQLFITTGTVEVHLTRIYRKLGVRSRTELARLAAEGTLEFGNVYP